MVQIEYLPIVLTGIGIIVSILYYTSVLRNANKTQQQQLDTRQAQLFMQIYDKWMSPTLSEAWNTIQKYEFKDYQDFKTFFMTWDEATPEHTAFGHLIGYYEGVGVLVKEGLIDIRMVALLMTGMTTSFYSKLLPYAERARKEFGMDWFAIETEYLYNELTKYIQEHPNYRNE